MGKKGKVGSLSIYFISNQKIRDNNCKELNWLKIPKLTRSVIPASLQVLEGAWQSHTNLLRACFLVTLLAMT